MTDIDKKKEKIYDVNVKANKHFFMVKKKEERQNPTKRTKILIWAAAAGRCTFCNRLVIENEDLVDNRK